MAELRGITAAKALHQSDLARATGLSESKVSRLLHRRQELCMDEFVQICNALDVNPVDVVVAAEDRLPDGALRLNAKRGR